ncbi:hypothetical protein [Streptomyces albogriseolus]|uniref:hypothetical protein n=1 Tax=Streptomyces albogriseolus TaxID=1887 RepID=UPI003CED1F0C
MTTHIERLIQQLDDSTGPSYDARAEPIYIGSDAIPSIIDGLPSLDRFGRLTAIEVFEEVGDPRCGRVRTSVLSCMIPVLGRAAGQHRNGRPTRSTAGRTAFRRTS